MDDDERYRRWIEGRAKPGVPAGFADRVMTAVLAGEEASWRTALHGLLVALLSSRASRLGLCTLAGLACVFRMASLVALFLPG